MKTLLVTAAAVMACAASSQTLTIKAEEPLISIQEAVSPPASVAVDILPEFLLAIQTGSMRPEASFMLGAPSLSSDSSGFNAAPAGSLAAYRVGLVSPLPVTALSGSGWNGQPAPSEAVVPPVQEANTYRPDYAPAPTNTYAPPPVFGQDNLRGYGYHPYSSSGD